jgi:hypothetical protein
MDYIENEEFQKFIENKTCRGCGNHCLLSEPNCGRSRIYINDEYEKFKNIEN